MATRHGGTQATVALDAAGAQYTLHEYVVEGVAPGKAAPAKAGPGKTGDETYGEAVAAAIGVEPDRVFKTLIANVDNELVVAVVPVVTTLDLKALATAVTGKRADLADIALAERTTGYVVGGISPFGQRRKLRAVVDETVDLFDTVFVSAGKRGLQVEVTPADLLRLTEATAWPIGRQ
jgi:Cys-tRNA(Pro)/Cys-tRNA(Cys) deacylase